MEIDNAFKLIDESFVPRDHQKRCWELIDDDSPGITLLSGTGSGKTEAILLPSLFKNKRLVMIYPTRSLVNDQINRVKDYVRVLVSNGELRKTIILDLGDEQYSLRYALFKKEEALSRIKSQLKFWEDVGKLKQIRLANSNQEELLEKVPDDLELKIDELIANFDNFDMIFTSSPNAVIEVKENKRGKFFVEKSRKHFYGGDVILTTVDKFLYRFFGYGENRWNLMYPYRLYMGEEAIDRLVIGFDEAHTYDGVSYTNFVNLLSALVANGIKTVAMSATLPEEFISLTQQKFGMNFVKGGEYKGEKSYELLGLSENRLQTIKDIISRNSDKKVIVVRNTVRNAFEIFDLLEKDEKYKDYTYFYHGRLFSFVKSNTYSKLKEKDENNEPYILVTTHAIEVGCDLDADLLITDFCNPDQLIQRAGRCARKIGREGGLYILGEDFLGDQSPNSDSFLKDEESFDYGVYAQILRDNNKDELPEEEIREKTIKHNFRKDELTDALFHYLYSYIYEFDRSKEELYNSGIIATRSWVPSVNFFWLKKEADLKEIRKLLNDKSVNDVINHLKSTEQIYNFEPLSINLDSLVSKEGVKASELKDKVLVVATRDSESKSFVKGNINPYLNDVYVFCQSMQFPNINPMNGLIQVPKLLELANRDRGVITRLKLGKQISMANTDVRIEYLSSNEIG